MARLNKPTLVILDRGNGPQFYCRFTYKGHRQTIALEWQGQRITDPKKAAIEVQRITDAIQRGKEPFPERVSIAGLVDAYLAALEDNAPRTISEKKKTLGYFVKWANAKKITAAADITPTRAGEYLRSVQTPNPRWRNLCRNYLLHAFGWAVETGKLSSNPFTPTKAIKAVKTPKPSLPVDSLQRVIEKAPPQLGLMIRFAYYTGVRPGELCRLTWRNIHIDHRYADIASLKGRKTRPVTFPESVADDLARLRLWLLLAGMLTKRDYLSGPVFLTRQNTPYSPITFYHRLQTICRGAGVESFGGHRLRHTAATEMLRAGADLSAVRDALGHHSIAVTDLYTHANPVTVRRAFDALPDLGKKQPTTIPRKRRQ